MDRNISARDILGLAGSYLWALALILAGSLVGSFLVPAIAGALYGQTLRTTRSSALSTVLSSALFSLLHLTNQGASLISCLSIFLVSAFFCLLVAKLRSPWAAFG